MTYIGLVYSRYIIVVYCVRKTFAVRKLNKKGCLPGQKPSVSTTIKSERTLGKGAIDDSRNAHSDTKDALDALTPGLATERGTLNRISKNRVKKVYIYPTFGVKSSGVGVGL